MYTIKHLDCSLRDGGYYNNWDFKDDLINQLLEVLKILTLAFCEFINNDLIILMGSESSDLANSNEDETKFNCLYLKFKNI